MFTTEHIAAAHSKVKSGADFPAYIRDIKNLGVTRYETFVADGHTDYYGTGDYKITAPAKYPALVIAAVPGKAQFTAQLTAHQQGKTDYFTFCKDCAAAGVVKWVVSMDTMTCTYYDVTGNILLAEAIPQ